MLCRPKASSVSQVGLDAAPVSVVFFLTAVSPSVRALVAPEVLDSEPKVIPPSLVYTPSDLTSFCSGPIRASSRARATATAEPSAAYA
jgi:hypothetical protein